MYAAAAAVAPVSIMRNAADHERSPVNLLFIHPETKRQISVTATEMLKAFEVAPGRPLLLAVGAGYSLTFNDCIVTPAAHAEDDLPRVEARPRDHQRDAQRRVMARALVFGVARAEVATVIRGEKNDGLVELAEPFAAGPHRLGRRL